MKKTAWLYMLTAPILLQNNAYSQQTTCPENQVWNDPNRCIDREGSCNHYTSNCGYTLDENGNVRVFPVDPNGGDVTLNAWGFFYQKKMVINNLILDKKVTSVQDAAFYNYRTNRPNKIFCEKGSSICNGNQLYANTPTFQYEIDKNDNDKVVVYSQDGSQIVSVYADFEDLYSDKTVTSYTKTDPQTGTVTKYNGRGVWMSSTLYGENGTVYNLDKAGNIKGMTKRGPFTIPEANALTKDGPVNTVTITW